MQQSKRRSGDYQCSPSVISKSTFLPPGKIGLQIPIEVLVDADIQNLYHVLVWEELIGKKVLVNLDFELDDPHSL